MQLKFTYKYLARITVLSLIIITMVNCKKDGIDPVPIVTQEATDVNKFIYNGLKDYYLWSDKVPNLGVRKFLDEDSLNVFLNTYADPNKLFKGLLYNYGTVDKWSFLVDDSQVIDDWVQGISETMGFDFVLSYYGAGSNIFGAVRYVYKGSPAEKAGIKRGDYFLRVDDQQLTATNYSSLLLNKLTFKLSFASLSGSRTTGYTISLNGKSVNMNAVLMQENPIQLDTVLTINNFKVGYLVYNSFNAEFDLQLNDVFGKFKDARIDKLVIDLRYNGGGSGETAIYLASMIYGTSTSKVFHKVQYNPGLQAYIIAEDGAASLNQNFADKIGQTSTSAGTPINTLNMSKVYIITSDNTASASELVINGLKPYMQVVTVGDSTVGKYVGSWTIKDYDEEGILNPNHKWAMQPIVLKVANSQGVSDYVLGLFPDLRIEEQIVELLPFGDQNETLLKVVLNDIKGIPQSGVTFKSARVGIRKIFDYQDYRPFSKQMYINRLNKD